MRKFTLELTEMETVTILMALQGRMNALEKIKAETKYKEFWERDWEEVKAIYEKIKRCK